MKKNTGKPSEKLWEAKMLAKYGKEVYIFNIPDTGDIKGMMVAGFVKAAPADYLVTAKGKTYYAEIKSCSDKISFSFSQFTPSQNAGMLRQTLAGGDYFVFIHSLVTNEWYTIPATLVLSTKASGKKSLKWTEIKDYKND